MIFGEAFDILVCADHVPMRIAIAMLVRQAMQSEVRAIQSNFVARRHSAVALEINHALAIRADAIREINIQAMFDAVHVD